MSDICLMVGGGSFADVSDRGVSGGNCPGRWKFIFMNYYGVFCNCKDKLEV